MARDSQLGFYRLVHEAVDPSLHGVQQTNSMEMPITKMSLPNRFRPVLGACILAGMVQSHPLAQSPQPETTPAVLDDLLAQLQWRDRDGAERYRLVGDDITQRVFERIDTFVAEHGMTGGAADVHLRGKLDQLLGHVGNDDMRGSTDFSVMLPSGRFRVIGVEVPRGGGAISEDAISFRAYREAGTRLTHVTDIELPDREPSDRLGWPLHSINASPLKIQPNGNELWFLAWANVSPSSPYTITARLYGFDGERFRTVWAPADFLSPSVLRGIAVTSDGGFLLHRMPNFKEVDVITEHYAVTADGPQKVGETSTDVDSLLFGASKPASPRKR